MGLLGSLLLSTCGSWPVRSTEHVEVKIDGVVLPVWWRNSVPSCGPGGDPSQFLDRAVHWMRLLAPKRRGSIRLLNVSPLPAALT